MEFTPTPTSSCLYDSQRDKNRWMAHKQKAAGIRVMRCGLEFQAITGFSPLADAPLPTLTHSKARPNKNSDQADHCDTICVDFHSVRLLSRIYDTSCCWRHMFANCSLGYFDLSNTHVREITIVHFRLIKLPTDQTGGRFLHLSGLASCIRLTWRAAKQLADSHLLGCG